MICCRIGAVAALSFVLAACGDATDADLFGSPPASGATDASSVPGRDGAAVDAGVDGARANDAASADTSVPDTSVPDTSVPAARVACGMQLSCNVPPDVCCRSIVNQQYQYTCTGSPSKCANPGDVVIACAQPKDCPNAGDACCLDINQQNYPTATSCKPSAQCQTQIARPLCDPNAPNICPNGWSCQLSSQTLPGYYFCR